MKGVGVRSVLEVCEKLEKMKGKLFQRMVCGKSNTKSFDEILEDVKKDRKCRRKFSRNVLILHF